MDYKEALKLATAQKPKENMLIIEVAYDKKLLLSYKDGIACMAALASAEVLEDSYGNPTRIAELEKHTVSCRPFSSNEYQRIKIATLLNVSLDDLKQHEAPA
jgi:hypothetical protein